jgi:hypothetical protein
VKDSAPWSSNHVAVLNHNFETFILSTWKNASDHAFWVKTAYLLHSCPSKLHTCGFCIKKIFFRLLGGFISRVQTPFNQVKLGQKRRKSLGKLTVRSWAGDFLRYEMPGCWFSSHVYNMDMTNGDAISERHCRRFWHNHFWYQKWSSARKRSRNVSNNLR